MQADVELVLGGAAILKQLLDKGNAGAADPNLVATVIAHASSEALAAIAVQYSPSQLVAPYPDILVFATARLAGYYAWTMGSDGNALPDGAMRLKDDALSVFDRIAKRQLSLGIAIDPATNQAVAEIDRNPNNDQTTRASTSGSIW